MSDDDKEVLNDMPEYVRELWGYSFVQRLIDYFVSGDGTVYHYTSALGFAEVTKRNRIWVTNSAYLNDQGELSYPVRLAVDVVHERWKAAETDKKKMFLNSVARSLQSHEAFQRWYVACFSHQGNQLSQWRAYCPDGGYSLGFDRKKLAKVFNDRGFRCGDVIYDEAVQRSKINDIIEKHVENAQRVRGKYPDVPDAEFDNESVNTLSLALSEEFIFFKAKSFAEEAEWRVVRYLLPDQEVHFRARNGILTPYLEAEIADLDGRLPLVKVWVSPLGDQLLAAESAALRLHTLGYTDSRRLVDVPDYSLRF